MAQNPYQFSTVEGEAAAAGRNHALRRLRCVLTFTVMGSITGILSGYLWSSSPYARHFPGMVFGIGLAAATMAFSKEFRLWISVLLIMVSYAGFYLAVHIWTETGLPPVIERAAMLIVGVTPIATIYVLTLRKIALWRFVVSIGIATLLGGAGFLFFTNMRGQMIAYGLDSAIAQAILEALRFACWQVCVATAIGAALPMNGNQTTASDRI